MKSTPPELKSRFQSLVAKVSGAVPRAMFGQVGAMISDHMFAGTFEDQIVLRLPEPERAMFVRMFGGGPFEPMPGRPMREYVCAPADVVHDDPTLLAWMKRAAQHAKTLPPKGAKPGAGKKAGAKPATRAKPAAPRARVSSAKTAPKRAAAGRASAAGSTAKRRVAKKASVPKTAAKRAASPKKAAARPARKR